MTGWASLAASEVQVYDRNGLVGEACCDIIAAALPAHLKYAALTLVRFDQCPILHIPDVQRPVERAAGQVPACTLHEGVLRVFASMFC
jgi:hypothetical protein